MRSFLFVIGTNIIVKIDSGFSFFLVGTKVIVKKYSGCFPLSLVLRELSKYTPVVSLCSWYCGNCQNIIWLFPFVLGTEGIVKIYSGCFPLSLVLRELSKYTPVVSLCPWN